MTTSAVICKTNLHLQHQQKRVVVGVVVVAFD